MSASSEEGPAGVLRLADVPTPAFVLNRRAMLRNCRRVKSEAAKKGVGIRRLRPHVKTHKTSQGAYAQAFGRLPGKNAPNGSGADIAGGDEEGGHGHGRDAEVIGFVASTIPEIEMLLGASSEYGPSIPRGATNPFSDVLYGVPVSAPKLARIDALLKKSAGKAQVHVLIDHVSQLEMCEKYVERSRMAHDMAKGGGTSAGASDTSCTPYFTAFLKLDTGYHRAGVPPTQSGLELATKLMTSKSVKLRGIYSHCGHAYSASTSQELDGIAGEDLSVMKTFLKDLTSHMESIGWGEYARLRVPKMIVSVGSTPSLFHHKNSGSSANDEEHEDDDLKLELHPGNYVLFDRQQLHLGSCRHEGDVAGSVLSTVIGHYPDRNTILLDAGALALSKDSTPQGGACSIAGRDDLECASSSQEVTVVRLKAGHEDGGGSGGAVFPFEDFPLGSKVRLLPNHSCLSAACFDVYHVVDEDEEALSLDNGGGKKKLEDVVVVDTWTPAKGW